MVIGRNARDARDGREDVTVDTMSNEERMAAAEARIASMQAERPLQAPRREPETAATTIRSNASALVHSTLKVMQGEDTVLLPELTKRAGQPVRVAVRQLTVQELVVANLLPQRAAKMIDTYIRRGVSETTAMRRKYKVDEPVLGQPEDEVDRIAADAFNGDTAEVAKAWFELESAIACAACIEPGMVLKYDGPVNAQAGELLVWNLPETDVRAIANHALRDAFDGAQKVEPFRETTVAHEPVEGSGAVEHTAERAGDI